MSRRFPFSVIAAFLTHLAVKGRVAASTQNQALCAILFLYRHLLRQELGGLPPSVRARRARRLPEVLSRQEVRNLLGLMSGDHQLMAILLYGAGLRRMECLRLRIRDVNLEYRQITVRA